MKQIVFGIIGAVCGFLNLFWHAHVVVVLCGWFVEPLYAMPELGLATVAGLLLIPRLVKPTSIVFPTESLDYVTHVVAQIFYGFGTGLSILVTGWFVHSFYM